MLKEIRRAAIVNRGEPATRFIRAVQEYNRENNTRIETVVLFTSPDRHSRFVRQADDAVELGDPSCLDRRTGLRRSAYLDWERLERALSAARADAVWVGWGFAAERAEFAEICLRLGLIFIGPGPSAMRRLGDKINAKLLAQKIGVPVIPWGGEPAFSLDTARLQARRLGFPVAVKAAAGEGGRGIRRVEREAELDEAYEAVRYDALRFFDNPTVLVEKWLDGARHLEVQILADAAGTTWAIGTRDCSVQRRHQKVFEEAPAPGLDPSTDAAIREAAARLCRAADYSSAGTVEFLYRPEARRFGLLEVNTRLQVEHAVTELTSGVDLVRQQIHIARGARLGPHPPEVRGHAVEVRLNAEDPERNFVAAPGVLALLRVPTRPGLRLDSGNSEGDSIPSDFDSMFAKLIAFGEDRAAAIANLRSGLEESSIVVEGGATNRAFLLRLLGREPLLECRADTSWLDSMTASGDHRSTEHADVALLQAAVEVCDAAFEVEREQFFASASRMRPIIRTEPGRAVELRLGGKIYKFQVFRCSIRHYRVLFEGKQLEVEVDRGGKHERWLSYAGRRYRILTSPRGLDHLIEVDGTLHRITREEAGTVCAPAPSVVVSVEVKAGSQVRAGQRLALLEAMKMEMPVLAPVSGRVREVYVLNNAQVGTGVPLLQIDTSSEGAGLPGNRVDFRSTPPAREASDPQASLRMLFVELRHLIVGSDMPPLELKRLVQDYLDLAERLAPHQPELLRLEEEILSIFVDVSSLFRRQVTPEDPEDAERLSSGEYLLTYLRTFESRGAGLPRSFIRKLQTALRHYGSDSLDPTPALKGRLLWIYKAHQQMDEQVALVSAILERRLRHTASLARGIGPDFLIMLDALVNISGNRFPALGDLAMDLRYRCFELPLFETGRREAYREMQTHLDHLAAHPDSRDRPGRIASLVACPYPLANLLSARFQEGGVPMRLLMLEVLTRRYYRIRQIEKFEPVVQDGQCFVLTRYEQAGRRVQLISTHSDGPGMHLSPSVIGSLAASVPEAEDVVMDIYSWSAQLPADPDVQASEICDLLNRCDFGRPIRRVAVAIAAPGEREASEGSRLLTFRLAGGRYAEDKTYRGLHPLMSLRLQLWRLRNFVLERIASAEEIYLFRCMARDNPKDTRLFAVAEVRDLTPICDAAGRVLQLPHLERMLAEALASIRQAQLRRPQDERLHTNQVLLYIWPEMRILKEDLHSISRRLARQTEGLGMEQVVLRAEMADFESGEVRDTVVSISNPGGRGIVVRFSEPSAEPVQPLTEYQQKIVRMRQRRLNYPYEVLGMLTPPLSDAQSELPPGEFIEYDLDPGGCLQPVQRPYGGNSANIVVGLIRNVTPKYPEGMTRVVLLGDPSREMGSIAEPECRRILAALDLAESMRVPLEWFTLSAGAKIAMESGTENMDWIARVLRRLIGFTQKGGEVNVIVIGINVGAQPYWNAEATMLMHTRGILIMMPESAMVLTGKTALDYSGSVSAEDNFGIGGYERVMGPNGQAQFWAQDLAEACQILLRYYDHTYILPGEHFPRRAATADPPDRDVRSFPHGGDAGSFALVGDIFSDAANPGRKRPFDIRKVMTAVADLDSHPLERWAGMQDAEVAVVWDAHVGGYPVCMIGFESRQLSRVGFVATDGPEHWTSGTLFPMSSKKVARSINAASGNRPLVILANLSGFDGSPESMRRTQLEFGAEIGRAIVNFGGPIIFCVISRYHGGAFVVFSRALNDAMEVVALEGTYASVIGGAPAAAVVFAREVDNRTRKDRRLVEIEGRLQSAPEEEKRRLRAELAALRNVVRSEKLGEVADEFDRIHSVERALRVGSLDQIIPAAGLRPYVIEAIERGLARMASKNGPG